MPSVTKFYDPDALGDAKYLYSGKSRAFERSLILLLLAALMFVVNLHNDVVPCSAYLMGSSHDHVVPSQAVVSKNSQAVASKDSKVEIKPISKSLGLWKNKRGICHILTTRFMQLQPDLLELGKARLDLFRTFTLPSIKAQTTDEFLWLIFTDPSLHPELLDELVEMLKPMPNVLLLGKNDNFKGFKGDLWLENVEKVLYGNYDLLMDYHKAAHTHILLETRLDADDSMFVEMMDSVQAQAQKTLGAKAHLNTPDRSSGEFRVFCCEEHLEWGYFNPWERKSTKGHLFGVTHPDFCVSAGLTYGYQIGTKAEDYPTQSHSKMSHHFETCEGEAENCLERIDDRGYKYIMLRSRTPTSAGMAGVIPREEVVQSDYWKSHQEETWKKVIQKNFAVTPGSIWNLRENFTNKMSLILSDALKGQCKRSEFSCRNSSKEDLNKLLAEVQKNS